MTGEVKMTQRDIGAEILTGLEEISAWEKGEIELKMFQYCPDLS